MRSEPQKGFIVDFLGIRTRVAHVKAFRGLDGRVFGTPVPVDDWFHAETIEYVGLLKSVLTAKERYVALELGAGWGPWLISGATAARRRGIKDIRLHGVEGDPEHFASMQTHFRDNGFDPAVHRLDNAVIGVKAGGRGGPSMDDPSDDYGRAPLACFGEDGNSADDAERIGLSGGRVSAGTSTSRCCRFGASSSGAALGPRPHRRAGIRDRTLFDLGRDTQSASTVAGDRHALAEDRRGSHRSVLPARLDPREREAVPGLITTRLAASLEAMTNKDGTQVWRNPRL